MAISTFVRGRRAGEIAASIEAAINGGQLEPGTALPPVRSLANALDVSPTTVAMAYRSLQLRGLVTSAGRRGTRVSPRPSLSARAPVSVPADVRNLTAGNPDPSLLPDLKKQLRRIDPGIRLYGEPANRGDLLRLAAAQFVADGIPADFLAVTGGALDAVERVLVAHLRPGDRVAVEDPAYPAMIDLLGALSLVPEPVSVDDLGPRPDEFSAALPRVAACIVTPRAQNPFGSSLDRGRAQLLRRALETRPDVLVIEDDHAGMVAGTDPFTLCGRGREHWAVVRSVSKSLGPDLRLALVAGDSTTIARLEARQQIGAGWVSHILQSLVVALWSDEEVSRQLERATIAYAGRRQDLLGALAGHGLVGHARSGLNVWVPVADEQAAVRRLLDAGWAVATGERFRLRSRPAVRISIGAIRPDDIEPLAAALARPAQRPAHTRTG